MTDWPSFIASTALAAGLTLPAAAQEPPTRWGEVPAWEVKFEVREVREELSGVLAGHWTATGRVVVHAPTDYRAYGDLLQNVDSLESVSPEQALRQMKNIPEELRNLPPEMLENPHVAALLEDLQEDMPELELEIEEMEAEVREELWWESPVGHAAAGAVHLAVRGDETWNRTPDLECEVYRTTRTFTGPPDSVEMAVAIRPEEGRFWLDGAFSSAGVEERRYRHRCDQITERVVDGVAFQVEAALPGSGLVISGSEVMENGNKTTVVRYVIRPAGINDPLVDIERDGRRITGQEVEVIVGEEIALSGTITFAPNPPMEHEWMVPGKVVEDFVVTAHRGRVDPLEDDEKKSSNLVFHWWDQGTHEVVYSAMIDGNTYSARARFRVKEPPVRVVATVPPGEKGIMTLATGRRELVYVGYSPDRYTVAFEHGSLPEDFAGRTQYVQLVRSEGEWRKKEEALYPHCLELREDWALDATYPYTDGPATRDTPGAPVSYYDQYFRVFVDFRMYLLYRPDRPKAIYVPLQLVPWFWRGSFQWDPELHEHVHDGPQLPPSPIASVEAPGYPEWNVVSADPKEWSETECSGQ